MKISLVARSILTFVLIGLMLSVIVGCADQDEPSKPEQEVSENEQELKEDQKDSAGKKDGGEITVYSPQDLDYLDGHRYQASGTEEIMLNIFEGLVKPAPDGSVEPAVAEEYEVSDDHLEYTFYIRDGIKFHNNEPVTAEDVKYSLERLSGAGDGEEALQGEFEVIENVEIISEDEVLVTLEEKDAAFLSYLIYGILPKSNDGNHNEHPIGTGPFEFVEYSPEDRIVMESFENYWQEEKPYLDKVEFNIIPDRESALLAFEQGDLDIYPRIDHVYMDELDKNYVKETGLENMTQIMAMNGEVAPFDNLKVRQAINYAIDEDEIIEAVSYGYGEKLGSNFSPAMDFYYKEGLEDKYDQDLDKAAELLNEAGYDEGFDMTITVPSEYDFHVDTAQVIVEHLSQVDIDAEIELIEWGVWLEDVYREGGDYETTVISFTGKLDPHPVLRRYTTEYGTNFTSFEDQEYLEIIEEGVRTADEDKRQELYYEAQKILAEQVPAVFIQDREFNVVMNPDLDGYTTYSMHFIDMSTIHYTE